MLTLRFEPPTRAPSGKNRTSDETTAYCTLFRGKENVRVLDSVLPWLILLFLFCLRNACAVSLLNPNSCI